MTSEITLPSARVLQHYGHEVKQQAPVPSGIQWIECYVTCRFKLLDIIGLADLIAYREWRLELDTLAGVHVSPPKIPRYPHRLRLDQA